MSSRLFLAENSEDLPVLITKAQPVEFPLSERVKQIIAKLRTQHEKSKGVGLAAPQIGEPFQIFFIEISEQQASLRTDGCNSVTERTLYINPRYEAISEEKRADLEACVSINSVCGYVPRYTQIKFSAMNEQGEPIEFIATGFKARVLQHETDHLYGKLITDRLTDACEQGNFDEMTQLRLSRMTKQQRDTFNQIINMQRKKEQP